MLLSICIPNYNRSDNLNNILNSIVIAKKVKKIQFEVCISDNGSKHNVKKIINNYKKKLKIKFHRFSKNKGITVNFLKCISMAKGEFVWTLGNDDLILPHTFKKLNLILKKKSKIDFFYVNSFYLNSNYVKKFPKPFHTKNLPLKMDKFSKKNKSKVLNFWELIDPKISFDFLLGMFLTIFRRQMWMDNIKFLDKKLIKDPRWIANFDNTCFNVKVFANAFKNSKAFYCAEPLSINHYGLRQWSNLYPLIEIVRMPEMLEYYRKNGLGFFRYIYCRNFTLRNFFNYLARILLMKEKAGIQYVNFSKLILNNLFYPNVYLSPIYFFLRRIKRIFDKKVID